MMAGRYTWLAMLLGMAACDGAGTGDGITRADSAGIEIVAYDGQDRDLGWRFDTLLVLGGADSGAEAFYDVNAGQVAADSTGNLYVLDRAASRVVMFSPTGNVIRTMGAKGGGPGEFQYPWALGVSPGGVVSVMDIGKSTLVRFGPDGAILDQLRVVTNSNGAPVERNGIMLYAAQGLATEGWVERLVRFADGDSTDVVRYIRPAGRTVEFKSCGMGLSGIPPIFAERMEWTALPEGFAVVGAAAYDVRVYDDAGTLTRIIRRMVEPATATRELAIQSLGDGMHIMTPEGERVCEPEEVAEQETWAPVIPTISMMAAGPGGTLWVRHDRGPADSASFDIFTSDGGYLGSLPSTAPFPAAVLGDRFAAVITDENDVDRVAVVRVARPVS